MLRILSVFFFIALLSSEILSQNIVVTDPPRTCATMTQDSINRIRFPERETLEEFEYQINKKIKEITARNASGKTKAGVVTIPIIVHVIHNGEPVGSGLNLSQAQVKSQIEVLN